MKNYNNSFLKKIDWEIIVFLLDYLHHNPNQKRTNLSMKTGLNYSRFMRYIEWLYLVEWIKISKSNDTTLINLSSQGRRMIKKIQNMG